MKIQLITLFLAGVTLTAAQQYREPARILSWINDIKPDGSFAYSYQTDNGIAASAQGYLKNGGQSDLGAQVIQGQYSYTGSDGSQYTVQYIADENGFQPTGSHLPNAASSGQSFNPSRFSEQNIDPQLISGQRFIQPRFKTISRR